ncbi:hypothetical protein M404DRAFT_33402 [Pisolithus tinctorius Marx 270]|uniref:Uncharacterized protein n=1 Tax=Pisolithus tinctorius Marx 270 TaxID=870435 RepID=A0A0C3N5L2_PISTI|nr:hypothetical protein M404DRAFT_33402 [Pisolithus tinctorius Marx 270]
MFAQDTPKLPQPQSPDQDTPKSPQSPKTVSFTSVDVGEPRSLPSPSDSSLTSLESIELTTKIRKPPSKVGHPGRGGYNLEEHLRWSDDEMCKLKRVIHTAVKKYLDTMKSRSYQDFKAVQKVTGIARQRFPRLKDYEHCWPVIDMIHLHLKYLSSRHWQKIRRDSSPE